MGLKGTLEGSVEKCEYTGGTLYETVRFIARMVHDEKSENPIGVVEFKLPPLAISEDEKLTTNDVRAVLCHIKKNHRNDGVVIVFQSWPLANIDLQLDFPYSIISL